MSCHQTEIWGSLMSEIESIGSIILRLFPAWKEKLLTSSVNDRERGEARMQNMDKNEESFTLEQIIDNLNAGNSLHPEPSFYQTLSGDCPRLLALYETLGPGCERFWLGVSLLEAADLG